MPFPVVGPRTSVHILDAADGAVLGSAEPHAVHRTASIGKLILLIEVAIRFFDGRLRREELLERIPEDTVADSGLWQHLGSTALPAADLAVLVGSVSDNLATNVLLRRVGLPSVTERGRMLGLEQTALHDRVRDVRRPADPPTLSTGTAAELADLMARLHRGEVRSRAVSRQVLAWLTTGVDTSMAAGALGLDPLAHQEVDRGLQLAHKTGTDTGIRCDVGVVTGPRRTVAYAVLCAFEEEDRDAALGAMFTQGQKIREFVEN